MKRINLDQMKNMSIDNLIESYRNGYRLEEYTPITSLSNLPNFSNNFSNIHTLQGPLLDPVVNFGKVTVSIGYDAVATSIILNTNEGSKLPDPSSGAFNLVWWNSTDYPDPSDDPNKEIVRCTAKTTDTLTVTRPQEGTSATTKNTVGKIYKMILSPTAKMMSDISNAITARVAKAGDTMSGTLTINATGGSHGLVASSIGDATIVATGSLRESLRINQQGTLSANNTYNIVDIKRNAALGGYTSSGAVLALDDTVPSTGNILAITGGGFSGIIKIDNTGNLTFAGSQKIVGGIGATSGLTLQTTSGVGVAGANMHFLVGNNGTTEAMTILNSGNVGIGMTNPGTKLNVWSSTIAGSGSEKIVKIDVRGDDIWSTATGYIGFSTWDVSNNAEIEAARIAVTRVSDTTGALKGGAHLSFWTSPPDVTSPTAQERMRITNAGNVGIGTTTPTSLLDVNGTVQLRGIVGGTGLTVDAGGNVGIGTTSPGAKLDIRGANVVTDSNGNVSICTTDVQAINKGGQLSLGGSALDAGTGFAYFGTIAGRKENSISGNYAGYITLGTMSSTGTNSEKMRINSSGNVGIGTTNPTAKLEVSGGDISIDSGRQIQMSSPGDINWGIKITPNAIGSNPSMDFRAGVGNGYFRFIDTPGIQNVRMIIECATGNVGIGTTTPTSLLDVNGTVQLRGIVGGTGLTVDAGGNVGIGTTSPTAALHISNPGYGITGRVFQWSGATTGTQYFDGANSGANLVWGMEGSAGAVGWPSSLPYTAFFGNENDRPVQFGAGSDIRMTILSNGNIGIGTVSPGVKLDVDGDVRQKANINWTRYQADDIQTAYYSAFTSNGFTIGSGDTLIGTSTSSYSATIDYKLIGTKMSSLYIGLVGVNHQNTSITDIYIKYSVDNGATFTTLASGSYAASSGYGIGGTITFPATTGSSILVRFQLDNINGLNPSLVGLSYIQFIPTATSFSFVPRFNTLNVEGIATIMGNVGIGTMSPVTKLHLLGNGDTNAIRLSSTTDRTGGFQITDVDDNESMRIILEASSGSGYIQFQSGSGVDPTALSTKMVINSNTGNVGIGTTIPTSLLDVNGTVQLRGIVGGTGLTVDAGGNVGIGTTGPTTRLHILGPDYTAINLSEMYNSLAFRIQPRADMNDSVFVALATVGGGYVLGIQGAASTSTTKDISLQPFGGNVGIGTTTPTSLLDVAGNIKVSGTVDGVDISTIPLPTSISYNNQSFINIVKNGNFESWSNGTTSAPDGFINGIGYPLGGIAREAIIIKNSSYSAKLIAGSNNYPGLEYDLNFSKYKNVPLTVGMWVYVPTTNTLNNALVTIFYDNGAMVDTLFSCPKNDTWTYYQQNINTSNYPSWNGAYSTVRLHISPRYTDTTEADVMYIDGLIIVEGSVCPTFSERPLIDDGKTLYISSTNNRVGIGTTVPTSTLDVNGTVQLRGIVGGTGLTVDAGGNVGIGTTNPDAKLHIMGETTVEGGTLRLIGSGSSWGTLKFGSKGANENQYWPYMAANLNELDIYGSDGGGGSVKIYDMPGSSNWISFTGATIRSNYNNITISAWSNTENRKVVITNGGGFRTDLIVDTGNVGIGTTNPGKTLDVIGDIKNTGNRYININSYTYLSDYNESNVNFVGIASDGISRDIYLELLGSAYHTARGGIADPANWQFLRFDNASGTNIFNWNNVPMVFGTNRLERMRITADGNVGIGTITPTSLLDVHGTTQLRGYVGGTGLTVDAGGNVGIGTTNPSAKLDIVGDLNVEGAISTPSESVRKTTRGRFGVQRIASNKSARDAMTAGAWSTRTSANAVQWLSITWSPELGLFAAVAQNGTANQQIMTSPDGITWTARTSANAVGWLSITWSPELGLFAAVAETGTVDQQIMTSPDGISWTARTSPNAVEWFSVTWSPELGLFAAVANTGTANQQIMTSPDGITWTARTSANAVGWRSVTWSPELGLFAAVAYNGTVAQQIMTSPDGITWTARTSANAVQWFSITWSPELGLFAAVALNGTANQQIMTSPDGITWTARTSANAVQWISITWSPELGLFAAVALNGTANQQIMTSPDGITWTARTSANAVGWRSVTWSPELGLFAAVANTGTANQQIMTSSPVELGLKNQIYHGSQKIIGGTSTTADLTLQTTTGVGTTGADMHFLVGNNGGTEAVTILNNGNVGVGTTTPGNKLVVNGGSVDITSTDDTRLTLRDTSDSGIITLRADGLTGGTSLSTSPGAILKIYTGSSDQLVLNTDNSISMGGNVGINITNPLAPLHIYPSHISGIQEGLRFQDFAGGENEGIYIRWDSDLKTDQARIGQVSNIVGSGSNLAFYTNSGDSGSASERMRILHTGNVGIGTVSPSQALHVANGAFLVQPDTAWSNGDVANIYLGDTGVFLRNTWGSNAELNSNQPLSIITSVPSHITIKPNNSAAVTFQVGGNVGIGTTTPGEKLQVEGVIRGTTSEIDGRKLVFGTDYRYGLAMPIAGQLHLMVHNGISGAGQGIYLSKFDGTTYTPMVYIQHDGNVGIGTASPSQTLEVNGNVKVVTGLIIPVGTNKWAT